MKEHKLEINEFDMDEIVSIECIGDQETIDITVDDTHMFFANDIYTHNSSAQNDIIEGDDISESYKKLMTGDFVASMARTNENKNTGSARIHIIKNRFGNDGMDFICNFDADCGRLDMHGLATMEGMEILKRIKGQEEATKDIIRKKWNQERGE